MSLSVLNRPAYLCWQKIVPIKMIKTLKFTQYITSVTFDSYYLKIERSMMGKEKTVEEC